MKQQGQQSPAGQPAEKLGTATGREPGAVVRIVYWWDRLSRNWIVQALDEEGNQIGDAQYAANRGTLPGAVKAVKLHSPGNPPTVRI